MANDFSFKGPFEPAFPAQSRNGHEDFNPPVWGVTKREYFAAKILQGMLANQYVPITVNNELNLEIVNSAVLMANELIKKLG